MIGKLGSEPGAPGVIGKNTRASSTDGSEASGPHPKTPPNAEEIIIEGSKTTVLEFESQPGTRFYIANHGPLRTDKPGNGGMRLYTYKSQDDAVADCVRLAEGMTRKHSMYRTGFSGAKLVVHADDVQRVDREQLMKDAASALESLQGSIYTGCDMNTTDEDMAALSLISPYVLAGIGSKVDTNHATAASVIGSILGALAAQKKEIRDCKFVVQGCGKVGSIVASELVRLMAKHVVTCDISVERSYVQGCENLLARSEGENKDWRFEECDVFVPCAGSLAIDDLAARELKARMVIGSANSPYGSAAAREKLDSRGVFFVPESISSAGAILADSIEWVDQETFRTVSPELCYRWVRDVAEAKTCDLFNKTGGKASLVDQTIEAVAHEECGAPMGCTFNEWRARHTFSTDVLVVGSGVVPAAAAMQYSLINKGASKKEKLTLVHSFDSDFEVPLHRLRGGELYSDPLYISMEKKAAGCWSLIEDMARQNLMEESNCLLLSREGLSGVVCKLQTTKDACSKAGLDHQEVDGCFIGQKWEGLSLDEQMAYCGLCYVSNVSSCETKACEAMLSIARDNGCRVFSGDSLSSIEVKDGGELEVITREGMTYTAQSCILSLGASSKDILLSHFGVSLDMKTQTVHRIMYEVDQDIASNGGYPHNFYVQNITGENGQRSGSLLGKLKKTDEGYMLDLFTLYPDSEKKVAASLSDAGPVDEWVRNNFEGVGKEIRTSIITLNETKDSFFVLDSVPGIPNVCIFAGGCGKSLDVAPVIGEWLCAVLRDEEVPTGLERFCIERAVK